MLFVVRFSGVEGSADVFKVLNSFEELRGALIDFLLEAINGREEEFQNFFPPENFVKLLRNSLTAKKLTGNENSMRIILDPCSKRPFDVKKTSNKDVDFLSVHTKVARPKSPCFREVDDLSVTSVRITVALLENTIPLREVEINCVKARFEELQKSLKE